jgi:hypothetical protein
VEFGKLLNGADMEEADNDVGEADNDVEKADNLRGRKQNHVIIDY